MYHLIPMLAFLVFAAGCGARSAAQDLLGDGAGGQGKGGSGVGGGAGENGEGDTPYPLVTNQWDATELAFRDSRIFWTNRDGGQDVRSCFVNSCSASIILYASFPDAYQPTSPAVDNTHVYWANAQSGTVVRCPIAGCPSSGPEKLAQMINLPGSIAIDEQNVYIAASKDSAILRCPKTGCVGKPLVVAINQDNLESLAVDADFVYWIESSPKGSVKRIAKNAPGSTPTVLADNENQPFSLTVAAGTVYWTTRWSGGAIRKCPVTGCGTGPIDLVSSQYNPSSVAVDSTHVYWMNGNSGNGIEPHADGRILRCPLSGCGAEPEVMADSQMVPFNADNTLVLGTDSVYWAVTGKNDGLADGAVMAVHK